MPSPDLRSLEPPSAMEPIVSLGHEDGLRHRTQYHLSRHGGRGHLNNLATTLIAPWSETCGSMLNGIEIKPKSKKNFIFSIRPRPGSISPVCMVYLLSFKRRFISASCLTNMQSFVSQPVWALTKLRTPAEPESGPGNAAVKFHGTLSKKRITWCSPACPPPACLAKHYPNYPMLPVPKLCIKYNLLFWNEPKTKSINIHKFFVSLHSFCFLWCSKVRTILHGSLCWHAFIIFV